MQAASSASRIRLVALYLIAALLAFAAFIALGRDVVASGEPGAFVPLEQSAFDHSTLVAWWLTWACYPAVLIPICIVLSILAWRFPAWRARLLLSLVSLLVSWRAADLFQHVFERARPLQWVVKHETSFSYPSSHAAIVAGFYLLWAALLYTSDLPARTRAAGSVLLALFAIAVCWSRLALGAHYLTDLIGGVLLGSAVACVTLAVLAAGRGRLSAAAE
ncbi:MAG TPA: phosphatase PAP2 family protein [Candidatus Cybelea sp.]|nr:phosphatase PAP2 family protein [Candidatus Cybelea sp.]